MADDHGVWVYAIAGELAEQWFSGTAGTAGAAEPADAPAGPGAAYLRRRREQLAASQASRRAAAEAADDIHAALAGEVTAALLRRPQAPQLSPGAEGMILNAAYLV